MGHTSHPNIKGGNAKANNRKESGRKGEGTGPPPKKTLPRAYCLSANTGLENEQRKASATYTRIEGAVNRPSSPDSNVDLWADGAGTCFGMGRRPHEPARGGEPRANRKGWGGRVTQSDAERV